MLSFMYICIFLFLNVQLTDKVICLCHRDIQPKQELTFPLEQEVGCALEMILQS